MKILSIHLGHHSSICILSGGSITFYQVDERLSRIKNHRYCEKVIDYLIENENLTFDFIVITFLSGNDERYDYWREREYADRIVEGFKQDKRFKWKNIVVDTINHHKFHAYASFFSSPLEEALCFVLDGAGSLIDGVVADGIRWHQGALRETESVYILSKNKKIINISNDPKTARLQTTFDQEVFKNYFHKDVAFPIVQEKYERNKKQYNVPNLRISNEKSVGWEFEDKTVELGFEWSEAGKLMGLAPYKNFSHLLSDEWRGKEIEASEVQLTTQKRVIDLMRKYSEKTGIKDIVLSGGYAMNCIANYEYLKELSDLNIYISPIAIDSEISIGAAYYYYLNSQVIGRSDIEPIENLYMMSGSNSYDFGELDAVTVTPDDVAELLTQQKVIALFQGKAEAGQRALGNRSILFDPRNHNGKDIVNVVKKRENFRPFAATVLQEHVHTWFDMRGLTESKFMQYAVECRKGHKDIIPAVLHVDDTCRLQTVTEKQNKHFYNLINCFYKKTNVPMLLNTSFNLAGEPLVQTFEDALRTLNESTIDYLYLPDVSKLIKRKC